MAGKNGPKCTLSIRGKGVRGRGVHGREMSSNLYAEAWKLMGSVQMVFWGTRNVQFAHLNLPLPVPHTPRAMLLCAHFHRMLIGAAMSAKGGASAAGPLGLLS